jgi:ATP-dependent Zn protease
MPARIPVILLSSMEETDTKKPTSPPPNQHVMDIFVIGLMFFAMLSFFDFEQTGSQEIPYSEFKQRLRDDDVESVLIRGDRISGNYRRQMGDFSQCTSSNHLGQS